MNLMTLHLAVLTLALWQVEIAFAESQNNAKEWLERMIQATQTLNYEGTFVYVQGQHLEAMHIIHKGGMDGEQQRMFSLSGSPREVVVADNQVICLLPKQKKSLSSSGYQRSPFPISLPQELDELEQNYRFKMFGKDRVADMKTQVIAIQPHDNLRFGYKLWLEQETAMVLRSAILNEKGHTLEQLMFTDWQVKPEIDKVLVLPPDSKVLRSPPASGGNGQPEEQKPNWMFGELPSGFRQIMYNRFTGASDKHLTEHIVLTDGLATVSVFLEPLAGSPPLLKGAAQMGAMNAYGKVINKHQALVVGEVPQATVQQIASALQPAQKVSTQ
jgi:sigma-E factor negative regulatory protein RseB